MASLYSQLSPASKSKQYRQTERWKQRQKQHGLCIKCTRPALVRLYVQEGKVIDSERLGRCWIHLKRNKLDSKKYRKVKGLCVICHLNPSEPCAECKKV